MKDSNFLWRLLGVARILDRISNNERKISRFENMECQINEIHKSIIFNDTIRDSEWLKYKSFTPGGWAVDYGVLYTLYRVLSSINPKEIIEFGLGQSSKMIHQYSNYYHVNAVTFEHDKKWIDFFNKSRSGEYDINIHVTDLETITYNGLESLTYKGYKDFVKDKKYDLIVVDGPFGTVNYSRPQVIDLVSNNLMNDFCLIIDDAERNGEKNTIEEVKKVMEKKKIEYCIQTYSASKKHTVICSSNFRFLTSL